MGQFGTLTSNPIPGGQDPMPCRCSQCGQRPGAEYAFYFGNKRSSTSTWSGDKRVTQIQYAKGGRATARVCDKCIADKRRSQFLLAAGLLLLAGPAVIGVLAMEPIVGRSVWLGGSAPRSCPWPKSRSSA
jgi:hypothetical protein